MAAKLSASTSAILLFTGAARHGMETIMCHAYEIGRRQSVTHLGGPVEDVAR
jgi:hypothetical protein